VLGQVRCCAKKVEEERDVVGWLFGVAEGVDGCQAEFVGCWYRGVLDESLKGLSRSAWWFQIATGDVSYLYVV
jgi:hypothetical protein